MSICSSCRRKASKKGSEMKKVSASAMGWQSSHAHKAQQPGAVRG
ncbi:MAG: hypothetical protein ACLVJH_01180 [Faecalibacterium prausnitzii]